MNRKKFIGGIGIGLMGILAGCAGFKTDNPGEFNLMTTERTPLKQQGPNQSTPPEAYLERGTRLRMLAPAGDHVEVETVFGMRGFVESKAIGPIP